ncbi:MAG: VWA domain-containing protein, partial [Ignavibacteriaceae bacterium]|nr:VWA domain-containing protein [Ignavibacteriaceae bacterium]
PTLYGNGVGIVNRNNAVYLKLSTSYVNVYVENQIAIVKTTQTFSNTLNYSADVQYAFPMPEGASGTNLRWKINGEWFNAIIAPSGNDSSGGGGGTNDPNPNPNLTSYLGATPIYFSIPQQVLADSVLTVELTYVQLLNYSFGKVIFDYPNDYSLIQAALVIWQELDFTLASERTIDSIKSVNHPTALVTNNGDTATVNFQLAEAPAYSNYKVIYSLSLDELGLFSFSTFLSDSASIADTIHGGYFTFIVEPEPTAQIIPKRFTLIIDRSGSMLGTKMVQAKNAATFIVNNLNEGDKFNIVDFSTQVTSFRATHVDFTPANKAAALTYISTIQATNLTNISGAFSTAVPQYANTNDSTANIIIFFTDGVATTGITSTSGILSHVQSLVTQIPGIINIHCFGVGSDVDVPLLSQLAQQNYGLAEFLGDDELETRITSFYLKIRNPVLINTQMSFSPNIVFETYPTPLPNLYIGQQLIISGRYNEAAPVDVTFTGSRFGLPVTYNYTMNLADTSIVTYQFLTKVWAKQKIDNLMRLYYTYNPNSQQANQLKVQIILLSIKYGVLSPFTIFTTNVPVELMAFNAILVSNYVEISWQTSTETNNMGFYVERKIGDNEWESIYFVQGAGTSTEVQTYSYRDDLSDLTYKGNIYYRLKQVDFNGDISYSDIISIYFESLQEEFSLSQNYPNPFNPSTRIQYSIPSLPDAQTILVVLKVYDILGNEITTLVNEQQKPGVYEVEFYDKSTGRQLASGVYLYKINCGSFAQTKKFILMK